MGRAPPRSVDPARDPAAVVRFAARLRERRFPAEASRRWFAPDRPTLLARAPGRLDVMGGIADYSGSLVLPMPIAEATLVAVQASAEPCLEIVSEPVGAGETARHVRLDGDALHTLRAGTDEEARALFAGDPEHAWAAYVGGVLRVLVRTRDVRVREGVRAWIASSVPEGKGVSSSAAIEVASMVALAALWQVELEGEELARLCQQAENRVVGAACGLMDPMASALGREGQLLELLCQPGERRGSWPLPPSLAVWGIDSGVRHAVTGASYRDVRTAAFMGHRLLAEAAGLEVRAGPAGGPVTVVDDPWQGYLANVEPTWFERQADHWPPEMRGADFLARHGGTIDAVTRVQPERRYAVRPATEHPIREHRRVQRFLELLHEGRDREAAATRGGEETVPSRCSALWAEMGALMFASHDSYGACGLGSAATDALVERVRRAGPAQGLHGARITGGGSGGTVAVLAEARALDAVRSIAREHAAEVGHPVAAFLGSSEGALHTGVWRV